MFRRSGDTAALEPPPLLGCGHLLEWMFECGPVNEGGMGLSPLSWQDIESWSRQTGVNATGWESGVIKTLSSAYLNEYQQAKDPARLSPNMRLVTEKDHNRVSDQISDVFGKLKKK